MERTFVALDLETTGLTPRLDRIIEVGAVRFRGGSILERFHSLVRPEVSIPSSVHQLTGLSDADVAGAPGPEGVLEQLVDFVGEAAVVAHSGHFDLSFLVSPTGRPYELFDTLDLARVFLPTAPSHSLPQLCLALGLSHSQPHRALSDADAARQLFLHLWSVARRCPVDLIDQMLEVTAGWEHPLRSFLEAARLSGGEGAGTPPPAPSPRPAAKPAASPSTDPVAIRGLLDPDGPMASHLHDYEVREAQQQMTLAIAQLFRRGGRLMVEAGPGTGKSLAYLLPAVHHAVADGERVVVATNTITLQEQLFRKDLPFLQSWLPFDFTPALLKGRANYVSLRRWNRYLNSPSRRADGGWAVEEIKFKLRMLSWLHQTLTGDRSEIKWSGLDELFWQRARSTADDCLAAHCPNYQSQRCFYWNSRRAAQDADLVVTNHALLLADALSGGNVLPPYRHLIVDEAHQLEQAAVESLVLRLGEAEVAESLQAAVTWLQAATGPLPAAVKTVVSDTQQALSAFFRDLLGQVGCEVPDRAAAGGWNDPFVLTAESRQAPGVLQLAERAEALSRPVGELLAELETAVVSAPSEAQSHALRELEMWSSRLRTQVGLIEEALRTPRDDRVYWLAAERRSNRPLLEAAPTTAGRTLQEEVLAGKETVVFTSSTLSIGDSFAYFRRGVGMGESGAHELTLPSPFDYLAQALLCLPTDLRELDDPGFLDQAAATVAGIGRALGGRTLVLFTAHQSLRDLADRLRILLAQEGLTVLAQNLDGTRRQLLEQFQERPQSILLGTDSFWEGIDIPGDALSCVVIVRLPFRVPTDPIQLARAAGVRDAFQDLMLPEAVLRLKQGFGRLIRKQTDRGAVVLLDHRVANRTYGRAFLDALPRAAAFLGKTDELPEAISGWVQRTLVQR